MASSGGARSSCQKPPPSKKRTKTRSFYIDERLLASLKKVAGSRGVSVNSLVINLLDDYVDNSVNAEAFGYISFPAVAWVELIGALDEEQRSKLASRCATLFCEVAAAIGYPKTLGAFLEALEKVVCRWSKWADYREKNVAGTVIVTLFHKHGAAWSDFLVEFLRGSLRSCLPSPQNKSIEMSSAATGATLRIPRELVG
jgi:hypothetical protein